MNLETQPSFIKNINGQCINLKYAVWNANTTKFTTNRNTQSPTSLTTKWYSVAVFTLLLF